MGRTLDGLGQATSCTAVSSPPLWDTARSTPRELRFRSRHSRIPETSSFPSAPTCRRAQACSLATRCRALRLAVPARSRDRLQASPCAQLHLDATATSLPDLPYRNERLRCLATDAMLRTSPA